MRIFFRNIGTKNVRKVPDFQCPFLRLKKSWWTTLEGEATRSIISDWIACSINIIHVGGRNFTIHWETCNAKTQITELWLDFKNKYKLRSAVQPFEFFATKLLSNCYLYKTWSSFHLFTCILPFQIDNLDSDTNQLTSILGATRSNIVKINSSLVNTALEVGLGMTQNYRDLLMVAWNLNLIMVSYQYLWVFTCAGWLTNSGKVEPEYRPG